MNLGPSHVVVHAVIRGFETSGNWSIGTLEVANRSLDPRNRSRWMRPPRFRDREAPGSNPGPPTSFLNSKSLPTTPAMAILVMGGAEGTDTQEDGRWLSQSPDAKHAGQHREGEFAAGSLLSPRKESADPPERGFSVPFWLHKHSGLRCERCDEGVSRAALLMRELGLLRR